jgi:hypothetical protein
LRYVNYLDKNLLEVLKIYSKAGLGSAVSVFTKAFFLCGLMRGGDAASSDKKWGIGRIWGSNA